MELSQNLRSAMSQAMIDELQKFLAVKTEESHITVYALKMAMEKVNQDISELEQSQKTHAEKWEMEKVRLEEDVKAAIRNEQETIRLDLSLLGHKSKMMEEEAKSEREKIIALEEQCQRIRSLLDQEKDFDQLMVKDPEQLKAESDNWIRMTQERVDSTLSTVLTSASAKQKWLTNLKNMPKKCIEVSKSFAQEASDTSKPCLGDGLQLQSFSAKRMMCKMQILQANSNMKFQKEMERMMAKAAKQREKIRAAEVKKMRQMEKKMRKELERIQQAELKAIKKKEKKEKKEAEKLEKKRQEEERDATRQSRFCFWRRSSSAN